MEDEKQAKQEALRLRKEGVPCSKIAERLGVCNATVTRWTRSIGKRSHTPEVRKKIVDLMNEGWKAKDIAKALNISSVSAVYQVYYRYRDSENAEKIDGRLGWVLNHPYQFDLHPEERERYNEVIANRRKLCPSAGYVYVSNS